MSDKDELIKKMAKSFTKEELVQLMLDGKPEPAKKKKTPKKKPVTVVTPAPTQPAKERKKPTCKKCNVPLKGHTCTK